MSQPPSGAGSPGSPGSPRTPRGSRLRDRVTFFEQVWSGGRGSGGSGGEDVDEVDHANRRGRGSPMALRPSSRASNSSFEESFERMIEEGELNGTKMVKFEKITVRKSVREMTSTVNVTSVSSDTTTTTTTVRGSANFGNASRTPSEEHPLEDSAYQSHGVQGSKSSSVTSFTRFPSEESIPQGRIGSPQISETTDFEGFGAERPSAEWYAEYRNQSFQNVAVRMEYQRSRSEYDAHIAEIKGTRRIAALVSSRYRRWCPAYRCRSRPVPPEELTMSWRTLFDRELVKFRARDLWDRLVNCTIAIGCWFTSLEYDHPWSTHVW